MAENEVTTMAGESKKLEVTKANSELAKSECDMAIAKLNFLAKVLKIKNESDDSDLILTWYERHGLAGILEDVEEHMQTVWSEALAPLSDYVCESEEVARG